MRQINIANCQGYVWVSDKRQPDVYINQRCELNLGENTNPFILEAQLYDCVNRYSYSIKYIDGEYIEKEYKYSVLDEEKNIPDIKYLPNRMPGVKHLKFKQVWREVIDPLCEKMPVLQPAELIFIGFELINK